MFWPEFMQPDYPEPIGRKLTLPEQVLDSPVIPIDQLADSDSAAVLHDTIV